VRSLGWRAFWLAVVGLAGSQAGHLLVYRLRFGAGAQALQSTGAHAAFPALATLAFALAGTALLAALGVAGAARAVAGRRAGRRPAGPSALELAAPLFTLQLAIFAAQETVESLTAGAPLPGVLLWYGIACQLPVALLGAVVLGLFLTRFEEAVERLRDLAPRPWAGFRAARLPVPAPAEAPAAAPRHRPARPGSRAPPPPSR
jgi:hypothetical protein